MDSAAKLISALAALVWPVILAVLLFKLLHPIRNLLASGLNRKFTIKVAGNELTMEEASEQQRTIVSDLQSKLAELEKRLGAGSAPRAAPRAMPSISSSSSNSSNQRILWVDDHPKNNSYFIASLEERGFRIDTALSTDEATARFKRLPYDMVFSDMERPENEKAGIDLTRKIKLISPATPVFIFCGAWAARSYRAEALAAGATEITSSGSTLLSALPLSDGG